MKQCMAIYALVCGLMCTTLVGLDFDATVPFSGVSNPATRFSYTINDAIDVVFGLSSVVPARRTEELDVDLQLGINKEMPLMGRVDMFFTFDNHGGSEIVGGYSGSEFYTKSFTFSKKWMYRLTDRVEIGVQAELAEIMLDGTYQVLVLQTIEPVVAMTIRIF